MFSIHWEVKKVLDEEAKAVQEVAKTTGKSLDIVKASGEFVGEIFGESFRQFGGAVSDWARYFRYKNFLRIADRVNEIHTSRRLGGKITPIPPQYALPLLEGASLESEESLQKLWAGLIANASDPGQKLNLKKIYIEILRGLEPLDAAVLELLSATKIQGGDSEQNGAHLNAEEVANLLGSDTEEVKISLQTLARYGCIIDSWTGQTWEELDKGFSGFRVNNPKSNFRLSHLGRQLVLATRDT